MVVHSASYFMQRIGKKFSCNSSILIMCVLMLTGQNMCIQPSMTLKYGSEVYQNRMFSLWATPKCRC